MIPRAVGYKSETGRVGFRVEFDERHGAHINVFNGKEIDRMDFEGTQESVDKITRQFEK